MYYHSEFQKSELENLPIEDEFWYRKLFFHKFISI